MPGRDSSPISGTRQRLGLLLRADSHEDAELRITDLNRFRSLDRPPAYGDRPRGSIACAADRGMPWVVESSGRFGELNQKFTD